jgi:adenylate cyclase
VILTCLYYFVMALEIERKFLVNTELLNLDIPGTRIIQGYLHLSDQKTIRIRIAGDKAYLTIKGPDQNGVRSEFEYDVPLEDARYIMATYCINELIEKIRYKVEWSGKTWEIDEFLGKNKGLWLAEIELTDRDEVFDMPAFIATEVTGDSRFHNSYLSSHPFSQ